MNDGLFEQATKLAKQPYTVVILQDELTDGSTVYIALNPELEGCKSQGKTIEEARTNLDKARIDYIHGLLEDGLAVPPPKTTATITGSLPQATTTVEKSFTVGEDFDDTLTRVIQPQSRALLTSG